MNEKGCIQAKEKIVFFTKNFIYGKKTFFKKLEHISPFQNQSEIYL
jgi:hypothetical protein